MISIEYWWVLCLLPLPLLVRLLLPASKINNKTALKVPFYSRIASQFSNVTFSFGRSWLNIFLAMLVWGLLVLAASNPVWLDEPIAIDQSGRAIMLAVDLSGSMKLGDMRWRGQAARRIDVVKAVGTAFIKSRTGDRLGLILFGSNAYLQAPLTFDRTTVYEMLDDATVGLAGPRTAIGDAIGLAVKSLDRYQDKEKTLILLTDGANNAGHVKPETVADLAAKNHIRIYTIGLGANQMQRQDLFGPVIYNPSQDLDERTLKAISKKTGGVFFRATSVGDLKNIYEKINQLVPIKSDQAYLQPKTPIYPWLLGIALLLVVVFLILRRT